MIVANERTGSLSFIDPEAGAVLEEAVIGRHLAGLARCGKSDVLVTDEAGGELIHVSAAGDRIKVVERLAVGASPVDVCVAADSSFCTVSLLWARRVAIVDLAAGPMRVARTIDLPFSPRKQWISPDGRLLVAADAFAGNLALIDLPPGTIRAIRSVQGNNIRGLAASRDGRSLLISHPVLDPNIPTTRDMVFWGTVIGNFVREVTFDHLLEPAAAIGGAAASSPIPRPIRYWSLHPLGQSGDAAGDPGELAVSPAGPIVVALSGVNRVSIQSGAGEEFRPVDVGRCPGGVAIGPSGRTAYVANRFDDSISVIDLPTSRVTATIALGPTPPLAASDLGEIAFHDARLSLDGWFSCQTCHTDGQSNGLLNDNHSDGSFGTPKRVLTLGGVADTGPWAWDGHATDLHDQVRMSILVTMQGKPEKASADTVSAIVAYLATIPPAPALSVARGETGGNNAAAIARGRKVFDLYDCALCHQPHAGFTSASVYDVGIHDEAGMTSFNPPSLRGVSQRYGLFHDQRAASLEEVFVRYRHPDGEAMTADDVKDLVAFLRSI